MGVVAVNGESQFAESKGFGVGFVQGAPGKRLRLLASPKARQRSNRADEGKGEGARQGTKARELDRPQRVFGMDEAGAAKISQSALGREGLE